MRLAKQLFLITGFILLLVSCAQVGTLSGGDQDTLAPRPVKSDPANETTHFEGNSFSITFDEYIRLNNPTQNVVLLPPHVKPTATINKKTLKLSWEGELQPHTTYALYLNKAVKDITEGNDSVMQFVFSTGDHIDTLSYTCLLNDAYSGQPLKDHLIGAFSISDTSLVSVAQSDLFGVATMNYLSPGEYRFIAFKDDNNDLFPQLSETIGFKTVTNTIHSTIKDSVPYRLFSPQHKPGIKSKTVLTSSKIAVGFYHSIDPQELKLMDVDNGESIDYRVVSSDSILVFTGDTTNWRSKKVSFEDEQFIDTLTLLNRSNARRTLVKLMNGQSQILPGMSITLEANGKITSVTDSLIKLFSTKDSSQITINTVETSFDQVLLSIDPSQKGEFFLELGKSAITTSNGANNNSTYDIDLLEENNLAILEADVSTFNSPVVIQCLKDDKLIKTVRTETAEKVLIDQLLPGSYTFRVIIDTNNNGKWDTGSFVEYKQPEEVLYYSEPLKLRPNWESAVTFTRNE